jgi:hypothetical protein
MCRLQVDPRDGSCDVLSYPGPNARDHANGEKLAWLCLPCWSIWLESHGSELCPGISCQCWVAVWKQRNPMRLTLALADVVDAPTPPRQTTRQTTPPPPPPPPFAPLTTGTVIAQQLPAPQSFAAIENRLRNMGDFTAEGFKSNEDTMKQLSERIEALELRVQTLETTTTPSTTLVTTTTDKHNDNDDHCDDDNK